MTSEELRNIIKCGETSLVQFKQEFTTQKEMAAEMIAFANGRGGTILFGIKDKTGDILGLSYDEIQNTSRELGNTANEQVRPLIYIQTEVVEIDDIWAVSGFKSRSSIFRILRKYGITLNRGPHSGPIKKWNERKNPIIKEDKQ